MKKIISIMLAVVVVVAMTAVAVSAGAVNANGHCETTTVIKKADSSAVVKDGKIGDEMCIRDRPSTVRYSPPA